MPPNADETEIESRAKQSYETNLKILEAQYRTELKIMKSQHQDEIITLQDVIITLHKKHNTDIFEMAKMMASRPITVEAKAVAESHSEKFTNDLRGANIANFANQVRDNARQVTSNLSQNIAQNHEEINKLMNYLREIAQEFPEVQREEAMVHLDDLQEDIAQPKKRKPQRIKTRILALLAIAGTVASGVAMTTDFSNNVLDLADKLGVEIDFDLHNPTRGALDQ